MTEELACEFLRLFLIVLMAVCAFFGAPFSSTHVLHYRRIRHVCRHIIVISTYLLVATLFVQVIAFPEHSCRILLGREYSLLLLLMGVHGYGRLLIYR